ncbi:MAG: hypothetical protein ABEH38_01925 [Flavobacteriales bacterium]
MRIGGFICLFLFLFSTEGRGLFAGTGQTDSSVIDGADLRTELSWHPDDLLLGFGGGFRAFGAYRVGIEFRFRPSYTPMIYKGDQARLQYQEKRYTGLLFLERSFSPKLFGAFEVTLGVSGGWSMELRRGFPDRTLEHWDIIPRAGIGREFGEIFHLLLEYRYTPHFSLNAKEHRASIRAVIDL